MDVEEGLTDSNEQSLHHVNHTGKPGAVRSALKVLLSGLRVEACRKGASEKGRTETQISFPSGTNQL